MARRIGIYGGTFDPVHLGHLLLAESAREQVKLDEVWFLPTGVTPHKQDLPITEGNLRADMLEFAIAGIREFKVDRREIRRQGASFTVDTLKEVREAFPEDEFWFIMGADSFVEFPTWRKPEEILSLTHLIVANRGVSPVPSLNPIRDRFGELAASRVEFVRMPSIEIASRQIRLKVSRGESIRFLVSRAVEQVIMEQRLYRIDREEAQPVESAQSL